MAYLDDNGNEIPEYLDENGNTITDVVQSSPMSQDELSKFLSSNPDLAGYDTYKKDPNAGRSANPTDVKTPTIISTAKDMLGDYFTHLPFVNDEGYVIQPKAKAGIGGILDYASENPGSAAMVALSPLVPMSMAGVGAMAIGGTGAHIIDRAMESKLYPTDAPINYQEEAVDALGAGSGAALTHGLFSALGSGMRSFAKPYMEKLEEAEKVKAINNARSLKLQEIEENVANKYKTGLGRLTDALKKEDLSFSSFIDEGRYTNKAINDINNASMNDVLGEVRNRMISRSDIFPEYKLGNTHGEQLIQPTDESVARYYLELKNPKPVELGKGYEALDGFPITRRILRKISNEGSLLRELATDGYRIPKEVNEFSGLVPKALNMPSQLAGEKLGEGTSNWLYNRYINSRDSTTP